MSTTNLDAFDADADHEAVRRSPHDPDGYTTSEARAEFRAGAAWGRWRTGADRDRLRDGIKAALAQPAIAEHIEFVGRHPDCTCKTCQLWRPLRALLDGEAKG